MYIVGRENEFMLRIDPPQAGGSLSLFVKTEDGEIKRLDDNVRLETLNEAKAFIAENCDKK